MPGAEVQRELVVERMDEARRLANARVISVGATLIAVLGLCSSSAMVLLGSPFGWGPVIAQVVAGVGYAAAIVLARRRRGDASGFVLSCSFLGLMVGIVAMTRWAGPMPYLVSCVPLVGAATISPRRLGWLGGFVALALVAGLVAAAPLDPAYVRDYVPAFVVLNLITLLVAVGYARSAHRTLGEMYDARARGEEAEARYRALFEANADGILVAELDPPRVVDTNPALLALVGRARDEVVGGDPARLAPPGFEGPFPSLLRAGDATTDVKVQAQLARAGGEVVDVEVTARRVEIAGSRLAVVSCHDVTDRLRTAAALRASEEKLWQAQKMEAVGRLAGGVAHDFNNLLSVILGTADLVREDLEGHPAQEMVIEIAHAAKRAAELTSQLLAFSRRRPLSPRRLSLNASLVGLERMLRRVLGEDVELVKELADDLDAIEVDPGQLEQMVLNLANNARDAMPKGGSLTLRTFAEATPGGARHVVLEVEDAGEGMDAETAARVFEPFFTTKSTGRGTGLGLAIVYGAMTQLGGSAEVVSAPGRGSTFRLLFPSAGEEVVDRAASDLEDAPTLRGTEVVLVVDDEPRVRRTAEEILARHGYRVLGAAGGAEALELLAARAEPVDLVLTDVVMPRMSGHELARRVAERWPSTRVILMSGYDAEGAARGAEVLVNKPFGAAQLLAAVRRRLDEPAPRSA